MPTKPMLLVDWIHQGFATRLEVSFDMCKEVSTLILGMWGGGGEVNNSNVHSKRVENTKE